MRKQGQRQKQRTRRTSKVVQVAGDMRRELRRLVRAKQDTARMVTQLGRLSRRVDAQLACLANAIVERLGPHPALTVAPRAMLVEHALATADDQAARRIRESGERG